MWQFGLSTEAWMYLTFNGESLTEAFPILGLIYF